MRECLDALAPDGPELAHAWRERIYSRTQNASAAAQTVPSDTKPIQPSDTFVRNSFTGFGWGHNDAFEKAPTVYEGTRNHSIPLADNAAPFIRKLMSMDSFRAEECTRWTDRSSGLEWSAVEGLLRTLLDGGFIRRADA
jgi:hypothetical protein